MKDKNLRDALLEVLVVDGTDAGVQVMVFPYVHRMDEETRIVGDLCYITETDLFGVHGEECTGEYGQFKKPGFIYFSRAQISAVSILMKSNEPTRVIMTVNTTGEPEWKVGDG